MNRLSHFILLTITVVCAVLYYIYPLGAFDSALFSLLGVAIIFIVYLFIYHSQHSNLKGYWLKPSNLFMLGYLAVNFQYLLDRYLGIKADSSSMFPFPDTLNHCLILGVAGLAAFMFGYQRVQKKSTYIKTPSKLSLSSETWFLVLFQTAMFVLFVINIDVFSFMTGTVYGTNEEDTATGYGAFETFIYISNALIICSIVLNNDKIDSVKSFIMALPKPTIVIVGAYLLLRLLSGDRGPVIYNTMLFVFGYLFATRRKIRLTQMIVIIFAGTLFISLIGIARNLDTNMSFSDRLSSAFDTFKNEGRFASRGEHSVIGVTEEMGFSIQVNQADVYAMESAGAEYKYGKIALINVLNGIPYMPSFFASTLGMKYEDRSSAGFANYYFFGDNTARTWSIGSTIIGDFYIDFGILGVILGLFLTGIILRKIDDVLIVEDKSRISPILFFFVLLFAAKAIYMPRAGLLCDWPRFIHGLVILFINNKIVRKRQL